MKNLKTYLLVAGIIAGSVGLMNATTVSENAAFENCQEETVQQQENISKTILVEVDYIIDVSGQPYVTYISSNDYHVNQRVINMIEQAEWPVRNGDIETVHSMVISLEY